jgi:hypothetical protein
MALVTPGTYSMAALTSEITNDPKGLGYAAQAGNSDAIAVLMNTSPEPIAAGQQEQIYRTTVASKDLIAGIVLSEFAALTQANRDYCTMLFSAASVNTGDANVRTQLGAIFATNTTSRANMLAAAQKQASRAQALWGSTNDGFQVTAQQVYLAQHPAEQ